MRKRLEKAGLIETIKTTNPQVMQVVKFRTTDAGRKALAESQ